MAKDGKGAAWDAGAPEEESAVVAELQRRLRDLETIMKNSDPRRAAGDVISEEVKRMVRRELELGLKEFFAQREKEGMLPGKEKNGGRGQEAMIDQMVAAALVRGKHTTGILKSLFNLMPGLIGR